MVLRKGREQCQAGKLGNSKMVIQLTKERRGNWFGDKNVEFSLHT